MTDGAPAGPSGAEVGGAGAEVAQAPSAPVESAIETASQSLAGTIESMEQSQDGAGSILSGLADGSIGAETQLDAAGEPSLEITPEDLGADPSLEIKPEDLKPTVEITPEDIANNQTIEIKSEDLKPTVEITPEDIANNQTIEIKPEDLKPTVEITPEDLGADPSIEIKPEDLQPTIEVTPEEVVAEATDLSTQVEALNDQMATVSEQMKELSNQQNELRDEVVDAISKMPGLEELLKALMEKATPEQKPKMSALMLLIQTLMALASSVIGGEKTGGATEKKQENPRPPVQPQRQASPQLRAQPTS